MEFHVQGFSEGPEKVGDELRAAIGSDMGWNTVLGEYVKDKEFSELY
jgi:hypothetical protein